MKINVFNNSGMPEKTMPETALVKKTVRAALGSHAKLKGEVNIVFVDAAEIKRLNKQYLATGALTDVISFNYDLPAEDDYQPGFPFGDVFVCADSARLQAKNLGHGVRRELLLLAAHGALHLAGYTDDTKAQLAVMDGKAAEILARLAPGLK